MVVGSPSRDSAPCDERGMEKQDALEISKRTVVHGDRLGRYAPFAALLGPSRGAVEWGNRCEDAHLDSALHKAFDQPILGEYRSSVILVNFGFKFQQSPFKRKFPAPAPFGTSRLSLPRTDDDI
jgi:hypothetical protein